MLNNGTDWIKDRWQAASDMHGTAIQGQHWVLLEFDSTVVIKSITLDWEAAFSDHYQLQVPRVTSVEMGGLRGINDEEQWETVFSAPSPLLRVNKYGKSPGVETDTPLHVVHQFDLPLSATTKSPRLLILKSNTGWGVSLWQIKVFGYR
jgi:hypothetical protein